MALLINDPVTLRMDVNGDIDIAQGLILDSGLTAVVTGVNVRLRLIRGEWMLNRDVGVPWFENDVVTAAQAILGQPFDELRLRRAALLAILDTPGIASIVSLVVSFKGATREASVVWEAFTEFGSTVAGAV